MLQVTVCHILSCLSTAVYSHVTPQGGAKLLHSAPLHITPVNSKTTSTAKPSSTPLTVYCTSLLTNWLPPLINALMSSLVPFSPELSSAHLTSYWVMPGQWIGFILLPILLLQAKPVGGTPACPRDCSFLIPVVFWDTNAPEILTYKISPSLPRSSRWTRLRKPTKQHLLWDAIVCHSSYMAQPL